ncbi:hypothetical protein CYMTET_12048 [Cymbomonas tetramitiformis]|uniref:alpha-1,2-Mannosidase n=1 Tax=Cymbomonas tetramitiformis TaxID=36881 RepID=A0AAE0GLD8_9CHLO|nr:hypothetical protein CYMTET_12048 [Cymbomonas tetramitiformis]
MIRAQFNHTASAQPATPLSTLEIVKLRDEAQNMFYHAYENYMLHAFPKDDLNPISCSGRSNYGDIAMTLIDSLDALVVIL